MDEPENQQKPTCRNARGRIASVLGVAAGGALLGILSLAPHHPVLVWNFSPSVPVGLYAVDTGAWQRSDFVAVVPDARSRANISSFTGLPHTYVLIKRVAAVAGDTVCRQGLRITINGGMAVIALATTATGRPLPAWTGCAVLGVGQVFLLADHPASFDGRYLGPTHARDILGPVHAIWQLPLPAEGEV